MIEILKTVIFMALLGVCLVYFTHFITHHVCDDFLHALHIHKIDKIPLFERCLCGFLLWLLIILYIIYVICVLGVVVSLIDYCLFGG